MKFAAVASLVTAIGLGGAYLAQPAPQAQLPKVAVQESTSPLEKARQAVCEIRVHDGAGSATLISRIKLEDGRYRYRLLTCYHVVDEVAKQIKEKGVEADRSIELILQPSFHGEQLRIDTTFEGIDWALSSHDWATLTFVSEHKLTVAPVATREQFHQVKAWDSVYMVGCFGQYAQQCRRGVISVTHNVGSRLEKQAKSSHPWNRHPNDYFRYSMPIWYGDSGGAIFDKEGRLIGMVTALTVRHDFSGLIPHSGVALKAHTIREVAEHAQDFFEVR